MQLTSQGEQEGHPTAGDPFHLTSLYIIPLIKTTTCQLGFNKFSVNCTEALMSNNRNKTAISEAYSCDLNSQLFLEFPCGNMLYKSLMREYTHIVGPKNLSNCVKVKEGNERCHQNIIYCCLHYNLPLSFDTNLIQVIYYYYLLVIIYSWRLYSCNLFADDTEIP